MNVLLVDKLFVPHISNCSSKFHSNTYMLFYFNLSTTYLVYLKILNQRSAGQLKFCPATAPPRPVKCILQEMIYSKNSASLITNVGYPGSGFMYFPLGFAHKGDQRRSKRDQDRTRRALSNALFTFSLTPPQTTEKSKILSKDNGKHATHLVNPTTIRPLRGRKSQTYLNLWSRTSSIEWTHFYSNSILSYPPKLRNTPKSDKIIN